MFQKLVVKNYQKSRKRRTESHYFAKGRSRRLRPEAHILDYPLGNPYDVLKVLLGPPYGP